MNEQLIDHLFRHQYGKMVAILTKIFGLQHLELIEDAVQDTFVKAIASWKVELPQNPEAWLTQAAKHRVIDLFRSINASNERSKLVSNPISTFAIDEFFMEDEIEDSQLSMIFTACHPRLDPRDQIAFALKTISGFSAKEIAGALIAKEETIKKRLQRARKLIRTDDIAFEIPEANQLVHRLDRVMEVIYVIFNEGFHSNKKDIVTRKELTGEALRLTKLILKKKSLRSSKMYALFALICFHCARLESKVDSANELINLADQDRSQWHFPLMALGSEAMNKALEGETQLSSYHYEAAIAGEHLRAPNFESTNWEIIAEYYDKLYSLQPHPHTKLSQAIVRLQLNQLEQAYIILLEVSEESLAQSRYVYYATWAEYYHLSGNANEAINAVTKAIEMVQSASEKNYLKKKKEEYLRS